jgi:hypothetical protein
VPHNKGSPSRSRAERKAARVLPEPVGADSRTWWREAIAGQASLCARVGAENAFSSHVLTAGRNGVAGTP